MPSVSRKSRDKNSKGLSLLPRTWARPLEGGSLVSPGGPGPTRRWGRPCGHWLSSPPGRTGTQAAPRGPAAASTLIPTPQPSRPPFTLLAPPTPSRSTPSPPRHLPEATVRHPEALLETPAVNFTGVAPPCLRSLQRAAHQRLPREPPHALTRTHVPVHTHAHSHALTCAHMLAQFTATQCPLGQFHRQAHVLYVPTHAPAQSHPDNGSRKAPW